MSSSVSCPGPAGRPTQVVVDYVGYTWGVAVRLVQRQPCGQPSPGAQYSRPLLIDPSWTLWADVYAAAGSPKLTRIQMQNYSAVTGRATLTVPGSVTSSFPPGSLSDTTFVTHAMLGYTDGQSRDFILAKLPFLALDPSSGEVLP